MPDLISVVIPTHNRSERLRQAIESVRTQGWKDLEIIVVDDASTDGTPALMEDLSKLEPRIRYIRNTVALGGGGARNAGIAAARGEYVAFLDDDDLWLPEKLERQYEMLKAHSATAAVSCNFILSAPGRPDVIRTLSAPADLQALLRKNLLGGASVCLTTRAKLREIGGFDPALRSCQDWDLWLKLFARGSTPICGQPLVRYITHDDGRITGNHDSEYRGRRKIHLRYKPLMDAYTRRYSLCELFFFRRVLFCRGGARLRGLLSLIVAAQGVNKIRFPNRLARILMQTKLRQTVT